MMSHMDLFSSGNLLACHQSRTRRGRKVAPGSIRCGVRPYGYCMYEERFRPFQDRLFVPRLGFEKCTIQMDGAVLQDLAAFALPRSVGDHRVQRLGEQRQIPDLVHVFIAKLGGDIEWEIAGEGGQRPILLPVARHQVLNGELPLDADLLRLFGEATIIQRFQDHASFGSLHFAIKIDIDPSFLEFGIVRPTRGIRARSEQKITERPGRSRVCALQHLYEEVVVILTGELTDTSPDQKGFQVDEDLFEFMPVIWLRKASEYFEKHGEYSAGV